MSDWSRLALVTMAIVPWLGVLGCGWAVSRDYVLLARNCVRGSGWLVVLTAGMLVLAGTLPTHLGPWDWIPTWGGNGGALQIGVSADLVTALALMGIGGITLLITECAAEEAFPWMLLSVLLAISVDFWLATDVWLMLMLQTALLNLGCVVLVSGCPKKEGVSGTRSLWLAVSLSDVCLVAALLIVGLDLDHFDLATVTSPELIPLIITESPAMAAAVALLWWLGILGRCWQLPFNLGGDRTECLEPSRWSAVWGLALTFCGWHWLDAGMDWLAGTPQTIDLLMAGAVLSALCAAWFSACSRDPRTGLSWLLSAQMSLVLLLRVSANENARLLSFAGLLLTVGSAVWLFSRMTATEAESGSNVMGNGRPPDVRHPSEVWRPAESSLERRSIGMWSGWSTISIGSTQGTVWRAEWSGTNSNGTSVRLRGGHHVWAFGLLVLMLGSLMVLGWERPEPTGRLPAELVTRSSDSLRRLLVDWLRLVIPGVAGFAAIRLWRRVSRLETVSRHSSEIYAASLPIAVLSAVGMIVVWKLTIPPWPAWSGVVWEIAVCGCGLVLGTTFGLLRAADQPGSAVFSPWRHLGEQRLYLPTLLFLGLNLPVRGLAQVCRFLDWFLWESIVPQAVGRLVAWGDDHESGPSNDGFTLLAFWGAIVTMSLTLMWLAR